jgi:hypothetical protein
LEIEDERLSKYAGGAPDITIVDAVELGVSLIFDELFAFHLIGFGSWLDTEMVFDHVSNLNIAMDGTRRLGGTAEAQVNPRSWLVCQGDVTFTDARFNHSRNRVPGVPVWLGRLRFEVGEALGPNGGLLAEFVGRRPLQHDASVDGYINLQVKAGWRFKKVGLWAFVENAANQRIMEGAYHFASYFDRESKRSVLPTIHYAAGPPITFRVLATIYL